MPAKIGIRVFMNQTTQLDVTSSTTLVNSQLIIPLAAGQSFIGRVYLPTRVAGTASGAKWQVVPPNSPSTFLVGYEVINTTTNAVEDAGQIVSLNAAFQGALANIAAHYAIANITVTAGVTGGDITVMFAQAVSDSAAASLLVGAYIEGAIF
jgi:hypothetical protein